MSPVGEKQDQAVAAGSTWAGSRMTGRAPCSVLNATTTLLCVVAIPPPRDSSPSRFQAALVSTSVDVRSTR